VPAGGTSVVSSPKALARVIVWDRFRYFREAFRVLKPGGRVYVDNFNLLSDEGWALLTGLCQIDPIARPSSISKPSTPPSLTLYATKAGFADIRVRTQAGSGFPSSRRRL